jgi:transcriptional regulator with XRE-family HTH domain
LVPEAVGRYPQVGALINEARKAKGLSRAQLATAVGARTAAAVKRWEEGGTPQLQFRRRLAETLELDPEHLSELWGVSSAHQGRFPDPENVVSFPAGVPLEQRAPEAGLSPEQRQFVETMLTALGSSDDLGDNWLAAARATARMIRVNWDPFGTTP